MIRFCAAVALAIVATACISTQPYDPRATSTTEVVAQENYVIGSLQTAQLGGPMVKVKHYTLLRHGPSALVADQDTTASVGIYKFTFLKGASLPILRQREIDGERFWIVPAGQDEFHLQVDSSGRLRKYVLGAAAASQEYVLFELQVVPNNARFSPVAAYTRISAADDMDFEIVFSGIDSQAVRFKYREFITAGGAGVREEDFVIPLTENVVKYRNFEIQIQSATSQKIEYIVVSDSGSVAS